MNEFHKTQMGKKFFDQDVPDMVNGLKKTYQTLDKAIVELNKIAQSMENKDARTEGNKERWLIGSYGKNDDVISMKIYSDMGDVFYIGKKHLITHNVRIDPVIMYYVYMDEEQMASPSSDGSYGSLQEALECIANELS